MARLGSWASVCLVIAACGGGTGDSPPADGGHDLGGDAGPVVCTSAATCDDTVFCNGAERCAPGTAGADVHGCVADTTPVCTGTQTCNEAGRRCVAASCTGAAADVDADGHRSTACGGDDCDDGDPNRFPGAVETCDMGGRDEDCDPTTFGPDHDGDGFIATTCCNHQTDGTNACGNDCDDTSMDVSPTAPEVCDGVDDNCNGALDEGVLLTFYRDADGDDFGLAAMMRTGCSLLTGYSFHAGDCDDGAMSVHPGATETCNMVDDDCDGTPDPGCACTVGAPPLTCGASDGMGGFLTVGPCHSGTSTCIAGTWGDCMGAVIPIAEACNMVDDDCDGSTDEGVQETYYRDADGDGYGLTGTTAMGCSAPTGYAVIPGDCDDTRSMVSPGSSETCNGLDDNCNGSTDEGVLHTYYADADGDMYGDPSTTVSACTPPAGYVADSTDCADADPTRHPGVTDSCDGIDNDCDGSMDPGCLCITGMMRPCGTSITTPPCMPGTQMCAAGAWGSCVGDVEPQPETCDGSDNDCNGYVDDGFAFHTCYVDADGDSYAPSSSPLRPASCSPCGANETERVPAGANVDCDDTPGSGANVHPGAAETCDRVDDDCSSGGGADTAEDADNDHHTDSLYTLCSGGYPRDDCDDHESRAFPGQTMYFTTAYCGRGFLYCPAGGNCVPTSGFCGLTPPSSATNYDYNCVGGATTQPLSSCKTLSASCMGGCGGSGPTTAVGCGAPATIANCMCGGTLMCNATTMTSGAMGCH